MSIDVTAANFEAEVLKSDKLVLVDFHAEWCGPCRALAPTLEKYAADNADKVKLVKVNVDQEPDLTVNHSVTSIPAVFAYKDGKIVGSFKGALPAKKVAEFVEKALQTAAANNINTGNGHGCGTADFMNKKKKNKGLDL